MAAKKHWYCRPCWSSRTVEAVRVRASKDRPAYKKRWQGANLKRLYGITFADYERMLAEQGGGCAICGSKTSKAIIRGKEVLFHVDHDHETGVVRGLLCAKCNLGLGSFEDEPDLLRAAAEYLSVRRIGAVAA
jgi:hypothetical protein